MQPQPRSIVEMMARLSVKDRKELYDALPLNVATAIATNWNHGGVSRRSQRVPAGDWSTWLLLSGRLPRFWKKQGTVRRCARVGKDDTKCRLDHRYERRRKAGTHRRPERRHGLLVQMGQTGP